MLNFAQENVASRPWCLFAKKQCFVVMSHFVHYTKNFTLIPFSVSIRFRLLTFCIKSLNPKNIVTKINVCEVCIGCYCAILPNQILSFQLCKIIKTSEKNLRIHFFCFVCMCTCVEPANWKYKHHAYNMPNFLYGNVY